MPNVQVFIWLPRERCVSPCGKGAYGHIAMWLPAHEQEKAFYISFGPGDQYSARSLDEAKYQKNYYLITIPIPLEEQQLSALHAFKNTKYNEQERVVTTGDCEILAPGHGPHRFNYLVNTVLGTRDNCTSVVRKFLKVADISLPIGPKYIIPTFLFNMINGGLGGYSVGMLSHLCHKCSNQQVAQQLGFSGIAVTLAFVLLSTISYCIAIFSYVKCPVVFRARCDFNPFFLFSCLLTGANVVLTGATGYFHSRAKWNNIFDSHEKMGTIVGASIGIVLVIIYHTLSCYRDSFNYLERPSALLNSLLKQGYREGNIEEDEHAHLLAQQSPGNNI